MMESAGTTTPARSIRLAELRREHLGPLADFFISERGLTETRERCAARMNWMLWENPAWSEGVPLGWVLETDDGRILGSNLAVPQRFLVSGAERMFLASSAFFVNKAAGPSGGVLFREYMRTADRFVLLSTTANAEAGKIWDKLGKARRVPLSDRELVGVLNWRTFAEEVFERRGRTLRLPPFLDAVGGFPQRLALTFPAIGSGISVDRVTDDFGEAEAVWRETSGAGAVEGVRTADVLRWRYAHPDAPAAELWAVRRRGRAIGFVGLARGKRGKRRQVGTLRVLDLRCPPDAGTAAKVIAAVLAACRRRGDDVVSLQGLPAAWEDALARRGFLRRSFGLNKGWFIDKSGAVPEDASWYLMPFDGDSALS